MTIDKPKMCTKKRWKGRDKNEKTVWKILK
jgi:hypothetical protein